MLERIAELFKDRNDDYNYLAEVLTAILLGYTDTYGVSHEPQPQLLMQNTENGRALIHYAANTKNYQVFRTVFWATALAYSWQEMLVDKNGEQIKKPEKQLEQNKESYKSYLRHKDTDKVDIDLKYRNALRQVLRKNIDFVKILQCLLQPDIQKAGADSVDAADLSNILDCMSLMLASDDGSKTEVLELKVKDETDVEGVYKSCVYQGKFLWFCGRDYETIVLLWPSTECLISAFDVLENYYLAESKSNSHDGVGDLNYKSKGRVKELRDFIQAVRSRPYYSPIDVGHKPKQHVERNWKIYCQEMQLQKGLPTNVVDGIACIEAAIERNRGELLFSSTTEDNSSEAATIDGTTLLEFEVESNESEDGAGSEKVGRAAIETPPIRDIWSPRSVLYSVTQKQTPSTPAPVFYPSY